MRRLIGFLCAVVGCVVVLSDSHVAWQLRQSGHTANLAAGLVLIFLGGYIVEPQSVDRFLVRVRGMLRDAREGREARASQATREHAAAARPACSRDEAAEPPAGEG